MSVQTAWCRRLFSGLGVVVLAGCSDGSSTDVDVEVSVSPASGELQVGSTLQFTATVTGATDATVDWAADCGTVGATGSTVTYTAPWAPGECEVTATSRADDSKSASAQVTVTAIPAASNLLTNAGFDTGIEPWWTYLDTGTPRAVWSATDARGRAGSGSAQINDPFTGNGATLLGLNFCIPSAPGRTYRVGGTAKRLQAVENTLIRFFVGKASDGCFDFDTDHWQTLDLPPTGTDWTSNALTFTTPAGTTTVRVSVGIWKAIGVVEPVSALVDDLFLVQE
jgi:hypothetical protein